jgi:hypothetical protein
MNTASRNDQEDKETWLGQATYFSERVTDSPDSLDALWMSFHGGDRDARFGILVGCMLYGNLRPAVAAACSLMNNSGRQSDLRADGRERRLSLAEVQEGSRRLASGLRGAAPRFILHWALQLADSVISVGASSGDVIAEDLTASVSMSLADDNEGRIEVDIAPLAKSERPPRTPDATLVHGTFAGDEEWWMPGRGEFHRFFSSEADRSLYGGGRPFSWGGGYSSRARANSAARLINWVGGGTMRTILAHSYGCQVVALAQRERVVCGELVMLSAPVTVPLLEQLGRFDQVVDIRVKWDPILMLAGKRQRLPSEIPALRIELEGYLSHSSSHSSTVWRKAELLRRINMERRCSPERAMRRS